MSFTDDELVVRPPNLAAMHPPLFPDYELELAMLVAGPPYLAAMHPPFVALVVDWIPRRVPKWDFGKCEKLQCWLNMSAYVTGSVKCLYLLA